MIYLKKKINNNRTNNKDPEENESMLSHIPDIVIADLHYLVAVTRILTCH